MSQKFIISHLDEQLGPFDETELKAKWLKGELLPIDYVFDDVKQDWILLAERFEWAQQKAEPKVEALPEVAVPPPLKEAPPKKIRAPDPVFQETTEPAIQLVKPASHGNNHGNG